MSNLAETLAVYADALNVRDLDESTHQAAKDRLLDSFGCMFAARGEQPVETVLRRARAMSGKHTVPVPAADVETNLEWGAFAAGTLIRYLDWNDTYLAREPAHPSDNFGGLLPVAAAYGRSGEDLLVASVLAYELQCRLCDAASLRTHGFDHVNYGLISTTLGVGKLMGLDADALTQAVNLAINPHVALRQARAGELSPWKGMAFANVARNAVFAAGLAADGMTGPAPIFEGKFGFFRQLTGEFELDVDSFGGRDGDFKINDTYIKYYPVEYHTQAAVHIALQLREQHDLDWRSVRRIENETYEAAVSIIGEEPEKWDPKTRETADHSMPYCIARALVDGEMTLEQFAPEKIRGSDVRTIMETMDLEENPDYTRRYGEAFPHRMVIETDENRYEKHMDYPVGHPENPLTQEQIQHKLRYQAKPYRTPTDIEKLVDRILHLEELESVRSLLGGGTAG